MPEIIRTKNGYCFQDNLGRSWYPGNWPAAGWLIAWLRRIGRFG